MMVVIRLVIGILSHYGHMDGTEPETEEKNTHMVIATYRVTILSSKAEDDDVDDDGEKKLTSSKTGEFRPAKIHFFYMTQD